MDAKRLIQEARNRGSYKSIQDEKTRNTDLSPKGFFGEYNKVRGDYRVNTYKGEHLPRQNSVDVTPGTGGRAEGFRASRNSEELISPKKKEPEPVQPKPETVDKKTFKVKVEKVGSTERNITDYNFPSIGLNTSSDKALARVRFSNVNFRKGRNREPLEFAFDFTSVPGERGGAHGVSIALVPANFSGTGFIMMYSDIRTMEYDPPQQQKKPDPDFSITLVNYTYSDDAPLTTTSSPLVEKNNELSLPIKLDKARFAFRYDGKKLDISTPSGVISANVEVGGESPSDLMTLFIGRPFFETAGLPRNQAEARIQGSKQYISNISFGPFAAVGPNGEWRDKPFRSPGVVLRFF